MSRPLLNTILAVSLAYSVQCIPARAGQDVLSEAQLDYNAGRYSRTVDTLSAAISKSPNDPALHFLLGKSYYQLREFPRAIASLEHAVQLAPTDSEYHNWLGKAYGRKAEDTVFLGAMSWARKTHKEFDTAVQLNPSDLEAQRDLIRYEINAPGIVGGGDDKALKHIQDLEKIDALQGLLAEGEFLQTKRRLPEADAVFAKILETNSDHIGIYLEVADYYSERQNGDKMGRAVAAAERIDPNDRRLKFYKGILLVLSGNNSSEAESLLKSYIATVPNNSDLPPHAIAHEWLGKIYEAQGKFSEAADQYRRALVLDPHNKEIADSLKRAEEK